MKGYPLWKDPLKDRSVQSGPYLFFGGYRRREVLIFEPEQQATDLCARSRVLFDLLHTIENADTKRTTITSGPKHNSSTSTSADPYQLCNIRSVNVRPTDTAQTPIIRAHNVTILLAIAAPLSGCIFHCPSPYNYWLSQQEQLHADHLAHLRY